MKKYVLIFLIVPMSITLAVIGTAQAAGDPAKGKAISSTCAGCHGADGNSANPSWPKLAGQHGSYIAKQLQDFKLKLRADPLMSSQAASLSTQDMDDLGAYFSSQTAKVGEAAADKVEKGEQIYRAGNAHNGVSACLACHGPSGAGNIQANFPRLSGQHATYVAKALRDFRDGKRTNDALKMMQTIAEKMSDKEIDAVAQYIQGLH